ncbi:MAG: hypothetical protein Ct9H300mP1_18870 [Planctomycetaceae bacterium]|nr:MAG: hypothetical protein Ct9H300mP1_18870 [Planctomycetaceae bacterium]
MIRQSSAGASSGTICLASSEEMIRASSPIGARDFQPTFEILVVFLGECDPEAAILVEIDRVPGLLFEVFEELDVVESEVGGETRALLRYPVWPAAIGVVPGSHRSAIDQTTPFDPGLGQVKCGTGSQHTASNDDDFGRGRKHRAVSGNCEGPFDGIRNQQKVT